MGRVTSPPLAEGSVGARCLLIFPQRHVAVTVWPDCIHALVSCSSPQFAADRCCSPLTAPRLKSGRSYDLVPGEPVHLHLWLSKPATGPGPSVRPFRREETGGDKPVLSPLSLVATSPRSAPAAWRAPGATGCSSRRRPRLLFARLIITLYACCWIPAGGYCRCYGTMEYLRRQTA